MTDLNDLPKSRLRKMAQAGEQILECYRLLGKSDANVVGELLRGHGEFYEWDHYPPGDVYDFETHAQYYYHAHPPEGRAERFGREHGHFHTFLRPKGMPKTVKPADVPDYREPEGANDALTHFVGISMDRAGFPIRLFTTNRWVTGETWYVAKTVISLIDRFEMDLAWPSQPVNVWITAMLRLFRPNIEALLTKRDQAVQDWRRQHPDDNVYEDRGLEITSLEDISVEDQIKWVDGALKATNR
ncbi:MAG: hypothetical protein ACE5GT_12540 [Rhodospirillales bacterium]